VAYGLVVIPQRHFSAFAGGVALAIMMVPTVTRTTEQMLLQVPQAVREAAFGLGIPQWRTTISITLATARGGIYYRRHVGVCAGRGRNGPADVHCVWKSVLEFQRK
jgi:ABC-type phosphate transport system permease subunit